MKNGKSDNNCTSDDHWILRSHLLHILVWKIGNHELKYFSQTWQPTAEVAVCWPFSGVFCLSYWIWFQWLGMALWTWLMCCTTLHSVFEIQEVHPLMFHFSIACHCIFFILLICCIRCTLTSMFNFFYSLCCLSVKSGQYLWWRRWLVLLQLAGLFVFWLKFSVWLPSVAVFIVDLTEQEQLHKVVFVLELMQMKLDCF